MFYLFLYIFHSLAVSLSFSVQSRIPPYLIYTMYISRDFHSFTLSILHSDTLLLVPFLLYLFLFHLQKGTSLTSTLCLFMLKTSFKKDTTPVFLSYLCRYCCFVIVLIVLFLGSSRDFSVGLVSPTTFPFRSQKSIGFSIP